MASRVEYIITADNLKAIQAATQLVEKTRQAGTQIGTNLERGTKSGGSAFDKLGKRALAVIGPGAAVSAALTLMQKKFQNIREEAEALRAEAGRVAEGANTAGNTLGSFVNNRPELLDSPADLKTFISDAKDIFRDSALGSDGLNQIYGAAATVQSSVAGLSVKDITEAIRAGSDLNRLDSSIDLTAASKGVAKLVQSTGVSEDDAAKYLRLVQSGSNLTDLSAVADSVGKILPALELTNTDEATAFSLFNQATKDNEDTTGEKSATAVRSILLNLNTRFLDLNKALGTDIKETDTGEEKLVKLIAGFRESSPAEKDAALSRVAKGADAKTSLLSLAIPGRLEQALENAATIRSRGNGDLSADAAILIRDIDVGARQAGERRRQETLIASARADEPELQKVSNDRALLADLFDRNFVKESKRTRALYAFDVAADRDLPRDERLLEALAELAQSRSGFDTVASLIPYFGSYNKEGLVADRVKDLTPTGDFADYPKYQEASFENRLKQIQGDEKTAAILAGLKDIVGQSERPEQAVFTLPPPTPESLSRITPALEPVPPPLATLPALTPPEEASRITSLPIPVALPLPPAPVEKVTPTIVLPPPPLAPIQKEKPIPLPSAPVEKVTPTPTVLPPPVKVTPTIVLPPPVKEKPIPIPVPKPPAPVEKVTPTIVLPAPVKEISPPVALPLAPFQKEKPIPIPVPKPPAPVEKVTPTIVLPPPVKEISPPVALPLAPLEKVAPTIVLPPPVKEKPIPIPVPKPSAPVEKVTPTPTIVLPPPLKEISPPVALPLAPVPVAPRVPVPPLAPFTPTPEVDEKETRDALMLETMQELLVETKAANEARAAANETRERGNDEARRGNNQPPRKGLRSAAVGGAGR